MFLAAKRALVFLLAVSIVSCGLPRRSLAKRTLEQGAATAAQAARARLGETPAPAPVPLADRVSAGEPVLAFGALGAHVDPDTTEFDFPEEEKKNLVRDVTVWVIASAFVAYFIVKVFIEEDEEEPEDPGPPGKEI